MIKYKKDVQKKPENREHSAKYNKDSINLGGDIYSMAYACFLDPEHLIKEDGYLQDLKISGEEIMNVFIGGLMIICFQISMLSGVVYYILYEMKNPTF